MNFVTGDLLRLALDGRFDVIVHGCNCQCAMGKGIALSIKQQFPEAYDADLRTPKGERAKLGSISTAEIERPPARFTVVFVYTQVQLAVEGECWRTLVPVRLAALPDQATISRRSENWLPHNRCRLGHRQVEQPSPRSSKRSCPANRPNTLVEFVPMPDGAARLCKCSTNQPLEWTGPAKRSSYFCSVVGAGPAIQRRSVMHHEEHR